MTSDWQSNPATETVLQAAKDLTPADVVRLPWVASALIRSAFANLASEGEASQYAVAALAACQQALVLCTQDPNVGASNNSLPVSNETTDEARTQIAAGANLIGEASFAGLQALVEIVLPPMHEAVMEFSEEPLIHELTTWFLLALSTGSRDVGPNPAVYRGILLAYPMPEKQMVWN